MIKKSKWQAALIFCLILLQTPLVVFAKPDPSVKGKYRNLKMKVYVPADEKKYGKFYEYGHYAATTYVGKSIPEGYWVYAAPDWYIWGSKDLAAAGIAVLEKTVRMQRINLKIRFEHNPKNSRWAKETLAIFITGIKDIESFTGIPFPGYNPFIISEITNPGVLGFASKTGMNISSLPYGSPWTMLHEVVHIWNGGVRPG